jgi:alcohol dehydrogenase
MKLEDVPMPQILKPTDVILRVAVSTICGSDLHLMRGFLSFAVPGIIAGHESCGEVVEVGSAVKKFKVGDRVAVKSIISCGECFFCKRHEYDHCEGAGMDFLPGFLTNGCQAEYMRLPFAEHNLYEIPEKLSYEDVIFAVDILSTGYTA